MDKKTFTQKNDTDKQLTLEESRIKIEKVLDKLDNLKEDEGGEPKEWIYYIIYYIFYFLLAHLSAF